MIASLFNEGPDGGKKDELRVSAVFLVSNIKIQVVIPLNVCDIVDAYVLTLQ